MDRPPTILVADDSEDDLFILNWAMAKSGLNAELHTVLDGEQAVAYLAGESPYADRSANPLPDLMLLDIKMPRMDGFEVLQWMQQHPAYRQIPVTMFSSSPQPEDIDRAYSLGAKSYLVKPISAQAYDGVVQKLREYLAEGVHASV